MANIGNKLTSDTLVLTTGRDFRWQFEHLDDEGEPTDFPAGTLFFELNTDPKTNWNFTIAGSVASLKVEHTAADLIEAGTTWQLVFLPTGEAAGGDPLALGRVNRQG